MTTRHDRKEIILKASTTNRRVINAINKYHKSHPESTIIEPRERFNRDNGFKNKMMG